MLVVARMEGGRVMLQVSVCTNGGFQEAITFDSIASFFALVQLASVSVSC